jgi:hypothetical protein
MVLFHIGLPYFYLRQVPDEKLTDKDQLFPGSRPFNAIDRFGLHKHARLPASMRPPVKGGEHPTIHRLGRVRRQHLIAQSAIYFGQSIKAEGEGSHTSGCRADINNQPL